MCDTYSNIKKMKFTISVKSTLTENDESLSLLIEKIVKYKPYIYDINFSSRMKPFIVDAHGVVLRKKESKKILKKMIYLQEITGVPVSPVFNNIYIPNTEKNLYTFVNEFDILYENGVRSVSIPHTLWLNMYDFKDRYPGLKIKNTVLRRVRSGQEFWNCAKAGFDYVNLDKVVITDREALQSIKRAQEKFFSQTGRKVFTAIIPNEGCQMNCPYLVEHYQHTMTNSDIFRKKKNHQIFKFPLKYFPEDHSKEYARDKVFPEKKIELEELCQFFDIVKLGGRRKTFDSFGYIDNFMDNNLHYSNLESYNLNTYGTVEDKNKYKKWMIFYKSCRFNCWGCDLCKEISEIKNKYKEMKENSHEKEL